jgi:mannosyl-3-phosphoglycerate phosphatase
MTETLASAVPPLIVFSDLDGTLLDEQYDFSPAKPALRLLEDRGIPLVLATSKTRAELATLRAALGGAPSLIFENGAGLALPRNGEPAVQIFGPGYAGILERLAALGSVAAPFEGFAALGAERVAALTGLDGPATAQAMAREASEPGLFHGDDAALEAFRAALAPEGLRAVHGGRFLHVMPQRDKVDGMRTLAERLAPGRPTVALGDGENDRAMLEAADFAVILPRPDGTHLALERTERLTLAPAPGPKGWAQAVPAVVQACFSLPN